jgi:hypothetical protein
VLGTWVNEHPYCTDSDIFLFLFLLTNVLIVSPFGYKCLLNALHVNVNLLYTEVSKCLINVNVKGQGVDLLSCEAIMKIIKS